MMKHCYLRLSIYPKFIRQLLTILSIVVCSAFGSITIKAQSTTPKPDRQLVQPVFSSPERKSGKRLALVIGNSAYRNAAKLANPVNDSHDIAETLKSLGFEVISEENLSADKMRALIRDFGAKLRRNGGVGLFYFAGHGIQVNGRNYLIPVEADILIESTIEDETIDVSRVLREMESAGNEVNIVILDACRNNPFARGWRSSENGLAQISGPTGTLIAYATSPGSVASDGSGRNGMYTAELLRQMRRPGLPIEQMFKEVRRQVKIQTGGRQIPWESSMLIGDFYFSGNMANTGASVDPVIAEHEYWNSIKNSTSPEDFRAYLKEYPKGLYASIARNTLRRLEAEPKTVKPIIVGPDAISSNTLSSGVAKQKRDQAVGLTKSGDAYRMRGENDSAIRELTEAIRLDPNYSMAYALRGASYHSMSKYDMAVLDLTQAIRIDPTFAWAYSTRATVYIAKGEYGLALSDLNQTISFEPKNYWAYDRRAEVYRSMGKNDLAVMDEQRRMNDLNEGIRLNPQSAQAYLDRCDAYRMKGNYDLAIKDCDTAVRLDPINVLAYAIRGVIHYSKGNYDLAISDQNEAIRLSPSYYWAYERRAEAYRRVGLLNLAEKDEQKAKDIKMGR